MRLIFKNFVSRLQLRAVLVVLDRRRGLWLFAVASCEKVDRHSIF